MLCYCVTLRVGRHKPCSSQCHCHLLLGHKWCLNSKIKGACPQHFALFKPPLSFKPNVQLVWIYFVLANPMLLGCDYHISVQSESDIPLPWQYPVITQRATCPIQCTVYLSHPRDISSLHVWIHPAGPLYLQIPTPSHHFQGKGTLRCTHFPYRCVIITNIALSSCVTMITSSGTLTLEKSDPTQGWTC